jgi:RNA polymerase sigma-70 factor, ECF subfamily
VALRVDDVDLVRDRALVERFQEGDPAAFETLYRRYFARLARFCQKRVGDPHEAEEIAQEAFARALRALPTFEGERRFYPWMTVIAGRLCIDAHRRRGRSEPSSQIDLGVIEGGQEKIVDEVDVQILATALGRIAPRHREVLDLREQQGWSYQEIADHYEVTLGTVEALLFRARKALKREFLAVVGGDRNWAGIPVLGAAFGKVAAAKARIEAWASGVVPALSGPAVAAAIAVTAVTGAAVGGGMLLDDDGQGRPTDVVRMAAAPAAAVTTTSLPELLSGVTEGNDSAPAAPSRADSAPESSPPLPIAAPRADTKGVDSVGTATADEQSQQQPLHHDVEGIFFGFDVERATSESVATVTGYRSEHLSGVTP